MTRRGFTLVEVLATVAILGLVMSLGMAALGGVLETAADREAAAIVRDLDARARIAARTLGPAQIVAVDEGHAVAVVVAATGEPVVRRDLPAGRIVRFVDLQGHPLAAVAVDASGRSIDHVVELVGARGVARLRVAGITGLVAEDRR